MVLSSFSFLKPPSPVRLYLLLERSNSPRDSPFLLSNHVRGEKFPVLGRMTLSTDRHRVEARIGCPLFGAPRTVEIPLLLLRSKSLVLDLNCYLSSFPFVTLPSLHKFGECDILSQGI